MIAEKALADVVGPLENLSEDQARSAICALADGEFGGISHGYRPGDCATVMQQSLIVSMAGQAFPGSSFREGLKFAREVYPDVERLSSLSARQATRVIVELDRRLHP